jgi:hypothetical protein
VKGAVRRVCGGDGLVEINVFLFDISRR